MRTTSLRFTASLAAAVVLTAACSAATGDTPEPTAEPAAAATETLTPKPEPTPEPTPEVIEAGQPLDPEALGSLPEGVHAYSMMDGTVVAVIDGDPVPEAVMQDAAQEIEAELPRGVSPVNYAGGGDSVIDAMNSLSDYTQQLEREIGRPVIRIQRVVGFPTTRDFEANTPKEFWTSTAISGPKYSSLDSAMRASERVAEEQGAAIMVVEF